MMPATYGFLPLARACMLWTECHALHNCLLVHTAAAVLIDRLNKTHLVVMASSSKGPGSLWLGWTHLRSHAAPATVIIVHTIPQPQEPDRIIIEAARALKAVKVANCEVNMAAMLPAYTRPAYNCSTHHNQLLQPLQSEGHVQFVPSLSSQQSMSPLSRDLNYVVDGTAAPGLAASIAC